MLSDNEGALDILDAPIKKVESDKQSLLHGLFVDLVVPLPFTIKTLSRTHSLLGIAMISPDTD
jgi:hypothetical protein